MIKESGYKIKSISTDAVVACILACLSICCMAGAVIVSYLYDGNGPAAVGLLGIGSLMLALAGVIFTVSAWRSADGGLLMKRVAGILNAVPLLVSIGLYILGWLQ